MSLHTITGKFYLLDGRSPSYDNNRFNLGDSYYYSNLLCSEDFVNRYPTQYNNLTKTVLLREVSKQD
jgi:hypothetical protein